MVTEAGKAVSTSIAEINDRFRQNETMSITQGIFRLQDLSGLIQAIRAYENFTEANDPYGEHDFGTLMWENHKIFWKIDYFDSSFEGWCDPLSRKCERVLTVMLSEEQ